MKNIITSIIVLITLTVNAQFTQDDYRLNGNVESVTDTIFLKLKGWDTSFSIEKLTFSPNGFLTSKSLIEDTNIITKNYTQKNDTLFAVKTVFKGKVVDSIQFKVYKLTYKKEHIEYNFNEHNQRVFERKITYVTPDSLSIYSKYYYPEKNQTEVINTQEVYKNRKYNFLQQQITYQEDGFIDKDIMDYSKHDRPYGNWTYAQSKTFNNEEQGKLYIKRTITYHKTPKCCPVCHKNDKLVKVVYGRPSQKLIEKADKGKVVLGGCMLNNKTRYCKRDNISF